MNDHAIINDGVEETSEHDTFYDEEEQPEHANDTVTAATTDTDSMEQPSSTVHDDDDVLSDNLGGTANIIVTDVEAANGIIHAIDAVVLPYAP